MATALASKPGLTGASALSIPKDWDPAWFRGLISNLLKGADVRNAVGVNGIVVSGTIASPYATISIGGSGPVTLPGPVTVTGGGLVIGTPTGGNEGAGTVNATNYYLNGVKLFQSGTFTGTVTGCTVAVNFTAYYFVANGICTLSLQGLGTSNSTAMTVTGLPAALQPATQAALLACNVANNSVNVLGTAYINPGTGTITFFVGSFSGVFTNGGTKGVSGTVLTYPLV